MKQITTTSLLLFAVFLINSQGKAPDELPKKLQLLKEDLLVNHFPSSIYACTDEDVKKYRFFWKHNTAVLALDSEVKIDSFGAYIYYDSGWHPRVEYDRKEFAKRFDCPKGILKKGQPYTFANNWRTDNQLTGGWALWYFIGKNEAGQRVCGSALVETKAALFDPN